MKARKPRSCIRNGMAPKREAVRVTTAWAQTVGPRRAGRPPGSSCLQEAGSRRWTPDCERTCWPPRAAARPRCAFRAVLVSPPATLSPSTSAGYVSRSRPYGRLRGWPGGLLSWPPPTLPFIRLFPPLWHSLQHAHVDGSACVSPSTPKPAVV